MKTPSILASALPLLLLGAACSTSSLAFVEDSPGYAVTRGRITQVENLHADKFERISDGLVVHVSEPGCRLLMTFANDEKREIELSPGTIIVYGSDKDYILQTELGAQPDR